MMILPDNWSEVQKYIIRDESGFWAGIREDAPQEVKDSYEKVTREYKDGLKAGEIL
jgi:hypothetical protein